MALYLIKDLDDDYHSRLGVWQITESEEELRKLCSVPSDELEEISYIRNESLRKQKLAVRALLEALFDEKVYLNHHDNGKPYIENSSINLSITHTNKYVAIIYNDTEEVGIDCESLDRDFSAVEKRALSEEEIEDLDDEKRNEQLLSTGAPKKQSTRKCPNTTWILQSRSKSTISVCVGKASWMPPLSARTVTRKNWSFSI